jgi:uncharacterized membrane protein required for colicin V production
MLTESRVLVDVSRQPKGSVKPDNLAINLFDLLLVGVLVGGMVHGRKQGMSGELLSLLKWLAILFGGAAIYQPVGRLVAQPGVFTQVSACLIVYLGAAVLILLGFSLAERRLCGKFVRSDMFGRGEYYLGMASGMVRFSCMLLVALAVLNARSFSPAEVKAREAFQDAAYGSQVFPTLHSVQVAVFEKSLAGPWIKQDLGFLLINPSEAKQQRSQQRK